MPKAMGCKARYNNMMGHGGWGVGGVPSGGEQPKETANNAMYFLHSPIGQANTVGILHSRLCSGGVERTRSSKI